MVIVLVLVVSGVFRSIGFTAYNTIVFADVAPEGMGNANTLSSTIQQLTMGLGVAAGALALRAGAPLDHLVGAASTGGGPFDAAFLLLAAGGLSSRPPKPRCSPVRPVRRSSAHGQVARTRDCTGSRSGAERRDCAGRDRRPGSRPAIAHPAPCRVVWSCWLPS